MTSQDHAPHIGSVTSGHITVAEIVTDLRSGYWSRAASVAEDAADMLQDLLGALKIAAQLAEQIQHGNVTPLGGAKLIADNSRAAIAKAEAK